MFCEKCGAAIPDGSQVCPECGENPRLTEPDMESNKEVIVYASMSKAVPTAKKKKIPVQLWVVAGILALLVVAISIINAVQVSNLKKTLEKEWYTSYESILQVLEFDDDEVEYRLETAFSWLNSTLFKGRYKVVSGNKIKIENDDDKWDTYKVEFNDDKTVMTISPAITDSDSSEMWYDIGE